MSDNVNSPSHYNRDGAMETIDEMLLLFGADEVMIFCKLNAWKYRARAMYKNQDEDMRKSDWYLKKYQELAKLSRLKLESMYLENQRLKTSMLSMKEEISYLKLDKEDLRTRVKEMTEKLKGHDDD